MHGQNHIKIGLSLFEVAASHMLIFQSYGRKNQNLDPESSLSMFSTIPRHIKRCFRLPLRSRWELRSFGLLYSK